VVVSDYFLSTIPLEPARVSYLEAPAPGGGNLETSGAPAFDVPCPERIFLVAGSCGRFFQIPGAALFSFFFSFFFLLTCLVFFEIRVCPQSELDVLRLVRLFARFGFGARPNGFAGPR